MTANTEIKKWQETSAPDPKWNKPPMFYAQQEIDELRSALEAKQQALEAAQQVAQRAGSGTKPVMGTLVPDTACKQGKCARPTSGCWDKCHLQDPGYTVCYAPPVAVQLDSGRETCAQCGDTPERAAQRKRINDHFASRPPSPATADFDLPMASADDREDRGRDAALEIAIEACCRVESSAYRHNNHERASGAKFCADAIREAMAAQKGEKGTQ